MTAPKSKARPSATKAELAASLPAPANKTTGTLPEPAVARKSDARGLADLIAQGVATNATNTVRFFSGGQSSLSLVDMISALQESGEAVNRGDLTALERMLNAQAVALNSIFCEMAGRAALNMGEHLHATESYMRLALKAQSQSRATVEALATIKNPPVVFARQANINNGGQQQVNNGPGRTGNEEFATVRAGASARPGETVSKPNELLEDRRHGSPTLDTRATATAGRKDTRLEPVGAINRAENR